MHDEGAGGGERRDPVSEPIHAVIFDRDGVLSYFDVEAATTFFQELVPISAHGVAALWFGYSHEHGYARTEAEEKAQLRDFWAFIGSRYELAPWQVQTLQQVDYADYLVLYPEVKDVLARIRSMDLRVGVLSNFALASLQRSLAVLGLAELVDVAHAGAVTGVFKPEPQAYLGLSRSLGVLPQNCLFFDDEEQHVDAAIRVGMRAYLVNRKLTNSDIHAHVVSSLDAILHMLRA